MKLLSGSSKDVISCCRLKVMRIKYSTGTYLARIKLLPDVVPIKKKMHFCALLTALTMFILICFAAHNHPRFEFIIRLRTYLFVGQG